MINNLGIILGITLMYSAPLIFTAMGGVISENAGVVNIGLEGMMTIGAFAGAAVGFYTFNPWLAFLAAGLAGGFLAVFHAIATVSFSADHVVSGIAINFIGPGLSVFLCRIFFDGAAMTKQIPLAHKIPRYLNNVLPKDTFWDFAFNQYATVYLSFIFVILVWFLLFKTRLGLRIRSVGEHPRAADTLGVNVSRIKYIAVILSGIFAGFGGAAMSLAIVGNFRVTLISGQGFIALAAMIFGKWRPKGAMLSCLLFGAAQGLVTYLGSRSVPIAEPLLNMLPYVITLLVLMFVVGEANGPAANGLIYEKNEG